jgi:transposase
LLPRQRSWSLGIGAIPNFALTGFSEVPFILWKLAGWGEKPRGFRVLPRRWVVERTFAWLGKARRLAKDYERLPETAVAMIYWAMSRIMLRRLARVAC